MVYMKQPHFRYTNKLKLVLSSLKTRTELLAKLSTADMVAFRSQVLYKMLSKFIQS